METDISVEEQKYHG